MKPTTLSTKRLILRQAIDIDSENLFRNYTSDPECSLFLTRTPHCEISQTVEFLKNGVIPLGEMEVNNLLGWFHLLKVMRQSACLLLMQKVTKLKYILG